MFRLHLALGLNWLIRLDVLLWLSAELSSVVMSFRSTKFFVSAFFLSGPVLKIHTLIHWFFTSQKKSERYSYAHATGSGKLLRFWSILRNRLICLGDPKERNVRNNIQTGSEWAGETNSCSKHNLNNVMVSFGKSCNSEDFHILNPHKLVQFHWMPCSERQSKKYFFFFFLEWNAVTEWQPVKLLLFI